MGEYLRTILFFITLIFSTNSLCNSTRIAPGDTVDITVGGVCRSVTNSSGTAIFFPSGSTSSFSNNLLNSPLYLTVSACGGPSTPVWVDTGAFGCEVGGITGAPTVGADCSAAPVLVAHGPTGGACSMNKLCGGLDESNQCYRIYRCQ